MQCPLSQNEHAAMRRYLSGIHKQLQDVSDLFTARYGKSSNVAEVATRTLVSATLLERELMMLNGEDSSAPGIELRTESRAEPREVFEERAAALSR